MTEELKEHVYVCPKCFHTISECSCCHLPYSLIQIDKKLLLVIRLLNEKWFFTESCCAGHIGELERIGIIFRKNYRFKIPLPGGFNYANGVITADISGHSAHAKKCKQTKLLKELYAWVETLESNKPDGMIDGIVPSFAKG